MPAPAASVLEAARALMPAITAAADTTEHDRRPSTALVEGMVEAGVFRLCVPRASDGLEVDPATMVAVLEALASADGAAGWCAMIGATTGVLAAYLAPEVARAIFASGRPTGGVYAPHGRATVAGDGYRLNGRWPFASGCEHCDWLLGGGVILDGGQPRLLPDGQPDARLFILPADEVRIVDTWWVSGLRGTGSHDIVVEDRLVPAARAVSLVTDAPQATGPLYRFPVFGLLALGVAAVALGIARRAIDELVALAAVKTPTGGRRRLAERAAVQRDVAEAEALVGAARAFVLDAIDRSWTRALAGDALTPALRARLRLAATHATGAAARAVDLMYGAGGGTAIYAASPLQRCFRDAHVVTQHVMVAPPTLELAGRVLLGLDTDTGVL